MKFLVFSDSHNYTNGLDSAIERHKDINRIIHCGDVASDCEYLEMVYGRTHSVCAVSGNNDFFTSYPASRIFKCEGQNIYVTHGHKEHVKSSLYGLLKTAKLNGVNLCIYGHTHIQNHEEIDGIQFLNPGSIGYARQEYAVIEVFDKQIKVELFKL